MAAVFNMLQEEQQVVGGPTERSERVHYNYNHSELRNCTISVRDLAILIGNHPASRTAFATPSHLLFFLDHTSVLDSECETL